MALNINAIEVDALGTVVIPRGTSAQRGTITPTTGDLFFDTDLSVLFVGVAGVWYQITTMDHSSLTSGLGNDDHLQYLLTDGTRNLSGDWDVGGTYTIKNLPPPTAPGDVATKEYVDDGKTWKDQVISILNTPPVGVLGDRYIVGLAPTGAWVGHTNDIAEWEDVGGTPQWVYETPSAGWVTFNQADGELYLFTGSAWVKWEATVDHSALTNLHTSPTTPDDHPQYLLKNDADMKTGNILTASWGGAGIKTVTVAFGTAMPSTNYRVFIQGEDSTGSNRVFTVTAKTVNGFTVSCNSATAPPGNTYWFAIRDGERHQAT